MSAAVSPTAAPGRRGGIVAALLTLALCTAHSSAIWFAGGGWTELTSNWPLAKHDHSLHFHSSTLAPRFFRQSATNAGYDPSFMAGYPKSVIFPESATLYDVAALVTGGVAPPQTHKLTVFLAAAALPWLVAASCLLFRLTSVTTTLATLLFLIYAWTDGGGGGFPLNYALFGMTSYLLAVPLGLLCLSAYCSYLERGGWPRWLLCAALVTLVPLVHVTSFMVVAPAALAAYVFFVKDQSLKLQRPIPYRYLSSMWMVVMSLALNAFWWWPGLCLRSMRGESSAAFIHQEGPLARLWQLATVEPVIQACLLGLGTLGLVLFWRSSRPRRRSLAHAQPATVGAVALAAYALCGCFWGYLAAISPVLNFLQPGRHTYVFFTALALGAAWALTSAWRSLRAASRALAWLAAAALVLVGFRLFARDIMVLGNNRVRVAPFLSSKPDPRLKWIVDLLRTHTKPGDRVLYEECGTRLEGVPDPYQGGRFSGLLPYLAGVELIGGPYLHAGITTNFTQFGENRLFGRSDWDKAYFHKYARIYRPRAIVCWSPQALAFCEANPDLVEVVARSEIPLPVVDPRTNRYRMAPSQVIFGRLLSPQGKAVEGDATARAAPGRLYVQQAATDRLDGFVVLSYHYVPRLRATPPVRVQPVRLGDDPVPFIGFRPPGHAFMLEMDFSP